MPTERVQDDDVSFKRTTARKVWMIMKMEAQTKHAHANEALSSKQFTTICDATVDDVFLSFSMLSICPFQLINVVLLTLSPPLLFASLVCSNLFQISNASSYFFIFFYLRWWERCQWNLIWQGKQTPKHMGVRYDHPWGGGGTFTASDLSQCVKQIPFSHRSRCCIYHPPSGLI